MICDTIDNDDDEVDDDKDEKDSGDDGGGDDGGDDDGAPDGQGYPRGVHELSWTSLREPYIGQDDKTRRRET